MKNFLECILCKEARVKVGRQQTGQWQRVSAGAESRSFPRQSAPTTPLCTLSQRLLSELLVRDRQRNPVPWLQACLADQKPKKVGNFKVSLFPEMGEAEAPAPPPAVPQNPIKIFISGNSGNKEVRYS